jgi:hypothetical protein
MENHCYYLQFHYARNISELFSRIKLKNHEGNQSIQIFISNAFLELCQHKNPPFHFFSSYILYIYTEGNNVCDIPATQKKKKWEKNDIKYAKLETSL